MWFIFRQLLFWIWASPATMFGLFVGVLSMPLGTRWQRSGHTLECHGGPICWVLEHLPVPAAAMTLGHVIWGQSPAALDFTRNHERVHVKQYERWGPIFIPAYLLASLWLKIRGRKGYWDNPFEREAYEFDRLCQVGECERLA
ncbi:MAG: hypothetical protein KDA80_16280 [Planctomycetaceae bacterium]|nr:hypothetical protein [Planctomycetaceae bacterium]